MNNKLKVFLPIILISSSALFLFQFKKDSTPTSTSSDSPNSNSIGSSDEVSTPTPFQKLSVLSNRCIGCGKCARIDPNHFYMGSNGKAIVSSSFNLDSSNLKKAIQICPGQAITLQ